MWKAHERYGIKFLMSSAELVLIIWPGDVVRFGPNRILSNSSTGLHGRLLTFMSS